MKHEAKFSAQIEPKDDLYYAIHKGLRLANAQMLIALGQADAADDASIASTMEALDAHLDLCNSHLVHENEKIHTVLDTRCPGASEHAADDHAGHERAFAELRHMAGEVRAAGGIARVFALRRLYQRFALFLAEDLEHMHEEETEIMPALAENFSWEERNGIHRSIVSSIPPAEMVTTMRFILKAASRSERIAMVNGLQAGMPGEIFDGLMSALTKGAWRLGDWDSLDRGLC